MKALILGLKALTPHLAFQWARTGVMPTLGSLIGTGAWGMLESVPHLDSASGWATFATGLDPGRHGVFGCPAAASDPFLPGPAGPDVCQEEPFWNRLGKLGYAAGVANFPVRFGTEPVRGFSMSETSGFGGGRFHPFANGLASIRGDHASERLHRLASDGQWDCVADTILGVLEARSERILRASSSENPDLLIALFSGAEMAQRYLWRFHEPEAFDIEPSEVSNRRDFVERVYRRMDSVLADFIRRLAPELVFVVSTHGMGCNQRGDECLPDWLECQGLLSRLPEGVGDRPRGPLSGIWDRLRSDTRRTHVGVGPLSSSHVDWSRTEAYCPCAGQIRINLSGREPEGIVPASRREPLCQDIIDKLEMTVDPVTGRPAVAAVMMGQDVYAGPLAQKAPDIIIRWKSGQVLNGLLTPDHAAVGLSDAPTISGSARPNGLLVAAGSIIRTESRVRGARIADLAPTILHLLGDTVPEGLDGTVVREMFTSEWAALHPVTVEGRTGGNRSSGGIVLAEPSDSALVEERLRSLGYVD